MPKTSPDCPGKVSYSTRELKTLGLTADKLLNSTYLFAKYVLGYDLFADAHKETSVFLDRKERKRPADKLFKLLLIPRDTFKSTQAEALLTRSIIQNPNISCLVFSAEKMRANELADKVRRNFASNEIIRKFWGDFVNEGKWRQDLFTVAKRTFEKQDPTVMTGGVDISRTGFHFDMIIVDDIQTEKNSATRKHLDNVRDKFALLEPMLRPGGDMIIVGTRWHHDDVYRHLIELSKVQPHIYSTYVKPAYEGTMGEKDFKINFPTIFDEHRLKASLMLMGSYRFSCNYGLSPIRREDQIFNSEWFRYAHRSAFENTDKAASFTFYLLCDPAHSKKETADYTAIAVIAVDRGGRLFIVHLERGRWSELEKIQRIAQLCARYGVRDIGYEKVGATNAPVLLEHELMRMNTLPIIPRVIPVTTKSMSKEDRIRQLQPYYQRGDIFHVTEFDDRKSEGLIAYERELKDFPLNRDHDDLMDAVQMVLHDNLMAVTNVARVPSFMNFKEKTRMDTLIKRNAIRRMTPKHGNWMMQ